VTSPVSAALKNQKGTPKTKGTAVCSQEKLEKEMNRIISFLQKNGAANALEVYKSRESLIKLLKKVNRTD